jgi:hypothetical protein
MRRFALIAVTTLLTGAVFYFYLTGRFALLRRTPDWKVVVNGVTIDGEVMAGRAFAVVTRRDKGKEHSYLLLYEEDVDQKGDMGRVVDCRKWIAPSLPILIETGTYPNCNANTFRMPLVARNGVPEFLTADGDLISIRKR